MARRYGAEWKRYGSLDARMHEVSASFSVAREPGGRSNFEVKATVTAVCIPASA
jgi:hypothetical protein